MRNIILFLLIRQSFSLNTIRRDILSSLIYTPTFFMNNVNENEIDNKKYFLNENLMDDKSHNIIQQDMNNIYFYSSVNQESCFQLSKRLIDLDKTSQEFLIQYGVYSPPINLHIQSEGGSLLHALYVTDVIKNLKTPVHTYIDGFAASAATLISVVGDRRFISKNSLMLIHQLSSINSGKYDKMEDEMENLDNIMKIVTELYIKNTKIEREKLLEILKKDIWLESKTCLEYGLVDVIF